MPQKERELHYTLPVEKDKTRVVRAVGSAGVQGAAAPREAEKKVLQTAVGSAFKEVKNNAKSQRATKPPDPTEQKIIDHFRAKMEERTRALVPFVAADDKRALHTLRWQHRGDPCGSDEQILKAIDRACASSGYPFHTRGFSLKEFCKFSPLQRFGNPVAFKPVTEPVKKIPAKKSVAQLVAERGGSYLKRLRWEGASDSKREWWTEVIEGAKAFCKFTGWEIREVNDSEICFPFLVELLIAMQGLDSSKDVLPGILMCKVADQCIDEQKRVEKPVIPIPPSFFAHKNKLRELERLAQEE